MIRRVLLQLFVCVPLAIIAIIVALVSVVCAVQAFTGSSTGSMSGLILAAIFGVGAAGLWYAVRVIWRGAETTAGIHSRGNGQFVVPLNVPEDDPLRSATRAIVLQHVTTLALERRTRLVPDKYGIVDPRSWNSEVNSFVSRVALPQLAAWSQGRQLARSTRKLERRVLRAVPTANRDEILRAVLCSIVECEVSRYETSTALRTAGNSGYSTPAEFEEWCAAELRAAGWDARVTGQTGDQGVDVRASHGSKVIVLQCKLYSWPSGNDAVQQVFAGKTFYRAHAAVVVSTGGFTKSARAIASQTGVHLLAPDQLRPFAFSILESPVQQRD